MSEIRYELVFTVRARDGTRTITKPLLPPILVSHSNKVLDILAEILIYCGDNPDLQEIGLKEGYDLARKIEQDVAAGKYKWEIEK